MINTKDLGAALSLSFLLLGTIIPMDAYSGTWYASDGGTGPWVKINSSCQPLDQLRGGDFNSDGKTDVFTTWGGRWRVSFGGTTDWKVINISSVDVRNLRFGDFDGDGKTDVFTTWSGRWRVSFGGTTDWKVINTSSVDVRDLRFGDFNGDGKTDVFTKWGGQWRVSLSGSGGWKTINASDVGVPDLGVTALQSANFVGNSKNKDTFMTDTSACSGKNSFGTFILIFKNEFDQKGDDVGGAKIPVNVSVIWAGFRQGGSTGNSDSFNIKSTWNGFSTDPWSTNAIAPNLNPGNWNLSVRINENELWCQSTTGLIPESTTTVTFTVNTAGQFTGCSSH